MTAFVLGYKGLSEPTEGGAYWETHGENNHPGTFPA